jgi:serine/threonine protein kinase
MGNEVQLQRARTAFFTLIICSAFIPSDERGKKMYAASIAPRSEYGVDLDGAAADDTLHAAPYLNYEAALTAPQKQGQEQQQQLCFLKNKACYTPSSAAKPTTTEVNTAPMDSPVADDVEAAVQDTMDLFISGCSIEPAYELHGELGRGKYGRVFLIENCVQHLLLALKATYDPNWLASTRRSRARAQQQLLQLENQHTNDATAVMNAGHVAPCSSIPLEANGVLLAPPATHISNEVICMRECNSPFIVHLHGAEKGEHGEDLLLMEYVDCGNLRQEILRRRAIAHAFTETEVAFIFLQLCMAVDHLHQRNILHHDLKPENIMLSSTGVIKLGDFGFARKYTEPVCNRVASTGCGTPYYLSPEALRGERYSLKSEMWSIGVILYELMALTGPFVAINRIDLRHKVHEGNYPPLPAAYSSELRDVCQRLLSQEPDRRPSTRELFTENEYLRGLLNELRRTSECSTKMTAEQKGSIFYSISAALRRRSPATPRSVAAGSGCQSWGSSLNNSSGVLSGAAATAAAASRARVET